MLPQGRAQVWLRRSGADPWEYDVLLMAGEHDTWEFKRDRRIKLPMSEIVWWHDRVPYIRPEVQLLLKARALRPKDQLDFDAVLPMLDDDRRAWLRETLTLAHPGHRWLNDL